MKKKLKTDNVEGLLEIVKAIQNGEDPEEVLQRREAERMMAEMEAERIAAEKEAEERAARKEAAERAAKEAEEKRAAKEAAKAAAKEAKRKAKKTTESAPEADSSELHPKQENSELEKQDEFEEILDAEDGKGIQVKQALGNVLGGLQGLVASLGSNKKKSVSSKKKKHPEKDEEQEMQDKTAEQDVQEDAEVSEKLPKAEEAPEKTTETEVQETESVKEIPKEEKAAVEKKEPAEKSEDERIFERLLERNGISPDEVLNEEDDSEAEHNAGEDAQDEQTEDTNGLLNRIKSGIAEIGIKLKQKGISRKELIMIAVGAVFAILVIAFAVKGIESLSIQRKKSENVTADRGLTVTVEKEPDQWCSLAPIELKFKTSAGTMKQVTVNGVNYLPNEKGLITVETGEWLLETIVTLEDGMQLNARIEIPKLDNQRPVLEVQKNQNMITVTAGDGRSEIKNIWYAPVSIHTPWVMPVYERYTEAFAYTPDTLYYFYAEDMAGNCSIPKKTTLEAPLELHLSAAEMALFPGETKSVQVISTPANALVNGLRFESTDASVVTVDGNGKVTAVSEGIATIKAVIPGVDEGAETVMSCAVTVSKSRSVKISAIGDCTLGTDEAFNTMTNFNAFEAVNGYSYFFRNVREILAADDVTFANLEGTFTKETTREYKEYAFKGEPSYTEILKDGSIEVVTLANNHSRDYGEKSLEDTKGYLTEADIDYCMGDTIAIQEVNGVPVAFIGIYVLNDGLGREEQVKETIAQAKAKGAQLIVVGFHWGSEKAKEPDETQTYLAHLAVDCGANLVVGHHPHVLQGIEKYNGVYIAYSLGNFCFGGNSTPSDMDSMIFQQTFTITEGTVVDDDQVSVIPCSVSSTPNYNNYQPTPANGAESDRIMEKINTYSSVYGLSFSASNGL